MFEEIFTDLTGHKPNLWQHRLFKNFLKGEIPAALDLPTGLGKTSVMALWLLARGRNPGLPRRLVYVVDRRAVVDQASTLAEELAEKSAGRAGGGLAVSTLRGKRPDNRRWLEDPAGEAIIVGTVDMIGSRLLFSGYGVSAGMRPYHAGLLAADSLFVLDEAHLCPAFQGLLTAAGEDPALKGAAAADFPVKPARLLSLSATGRQDHADAFRLTDEDLDDPWIKKRFTARKRLSVVEEACAKKDLPARLVEEAQGLAAEHPGARIVVFVHSREDAVKIAEKLTKTGDCALLTGERRVNEREQVFNRLKELGFIRGDAPLAPRDKPAFLVATAAGEVGVDLDADHMAGDVAAVERMIQRLGRVNRSGGDSGERAAEIRLVAVAEQENLATLLAPLKALPDGDASPRGWRDLRTAHPQLIAAATTPDPLRPRLRRADLEALAMTSLADHPGRPDPRPFFRGWEEEKDPQATVLWRRFLPWREDADQPIPGEATAYFDAAPPQLREMLEAPLSRIEEILRKRAKALLQQGGADRRAVVILGPDRKFRRALTLNRLAETKGTIIAPGDMVVAACTVGGLGTEGHLDAKADAAAHPGCLDDGTWEDVDWRFVMSTEPPPGGDWRLVHRFAQDAEENKALTVYVARAPNGERRGDPAVGRREQGLAEHLADVEREAAETARRLALTASQTTVLKTAGRLHDLGKNRQLWQDAMHAPKDGRPFAKTKGGGAPQSLDGYRHEFGSLADGENDGELVGLPALDRDLVLHLVAAHHGCARPVIHAYDPDPNRRPGESDARAAEAALRFARLQKALGPWGLAWWEAVLRAADQQASRKLDAGKSDRGDDHG
jgi:CRISPR-associated endonuclease/helicase Cas3